MVLENKTYVPTLAIRASEMNGLQFLPGATKDKMTPCFLLAPWANSNSLDKSIERIERAFPNRKFFLDIDRDYRFTNDDSEPQIELRRLLDPEGSYKNWIDFISRHENAFPCLQTMHQDQALLRKQIELIQELGRPYGVRIERERFPSNLDEIVEAITAFGAADFVIILEGGWTRDSLGLHVWFEGMIAEGLSDIDANVPIVLSCTSIPKMFTQFSGVTRVAFTNHQLFDQVKRRFSNRKNIFYGDWGSTRPRENTGFANRPLQRIDYPTDSAWLIARNKDDEWGFKQAAEAVIASDGWEGDLGIWGEEMILNTSFHESLGIDTPQKNVASRVNIHLHRQAFYGAAKDELRAADEDWED